MNSSKRLFISNILSYISFIIYGVLDFNDLFQGVYVFLAFLPYILVLYSTFMFNTKSDKNLKKVLFLSIPDFIIRLIALFVNFYLTVTEYGSGLFKIIFFIMIALFCVNLFIEWMIHKKMLKMESDRVELTAKQIVSNGSSNEVITGAMSAKESVVLFIIGILVIGYDNSLGLEYIKFWGMPFVILVYIYINDTYDTLIDYYKDKKKAKETFVYENKYIVLMLVLLAIYGYYTGYSTVKDFGVYMIIFALSLPRYLNRRKRIEQIYKDHMIEQK